MTKRKLADYQVKFLVFTLIFLGVFLLFSQTQAATSTLRGKAWWGDTLEYVYFNCLDDEIGELLNEPGNFTDGFEFSADPCSGLVHGVEIDSNNIFSGSAWNRTKGLIAFAGSATPPDNYAFRNNCLPPSSCTGDCWACFADDGINNYVYGWARAATGEWIKLHPDTTPVQLQTATSDIWQGHDIAPGDFIGMATSTTLSNLYFNCKTEDACLLRNDYKVYIGNLEATNLSTSWPADSACSIGALHNTLRWDVMSGQQQAFEIVVNTSNVLNTSTAVCWSGIRTSSAEQYTIPDASDNFCTSTAGLDYGEDYYWWLRLYNPADEATEWYQYNSNNSGDDGGDPDLNPLTFSTYQHEFPQVNFSWLPEDVVIGTSTFFTGATSSYYVLDNPFTCDSANCLFSWTTNDDNAVISSTTNSTTTINFFTATNTTITLQVADTADNYVCSQTRALQVNYGLPIWREIKAE